MFKKIIIGTLVLMVLGTSSIVVYAGPGDDLDIDITETNTKSIETDTQLEEEEKVESIQIIRPTFDPDGTVALDGKNNLLISVKVIGESNVILNVYKVLNETEEQEELVLGPEVIEPNDEFERDIFKSIKIKDSEKGKLYQGRYKMVFAKEGEEDPVKIVEFDVKKTEGIVNKNNPLELKTNIADHKKEE
ncbi:hypothetical protein [Paramaledivibacter caminithermalis]|nr:hypothetical protein [Paramaledivibacter caminithermalis]